MPTTNFIAAASAIYGFEQWTSTAGTVTIDSSVVFGTNPRSFKMNTTGSAVSAYMQQNGVMADAGRRFTFKAQFPSVAPAANNSICNVLDSSDTAIFTIFLTPGRLLKLRPIGGTDVNGTTALLANTPYRISVSYTISSTTVHEFRVYLNGVLEITASNSGTMTGVTGLRLRLVANGAAGANFLTYFDEVHVDDGTDLADIGTSVTCKQPAANNVNQFDTAVGANPASRWTNVNERPISIANGWQHAAATDVQENYKLERLQDGDFNMLGSSLVARCAWIWAKQATAAAGTPKIMDNGTETAVVLTTSAALYSVYTTDTVYPSNAAGIGMRSANHANATFLYECGTMIAYKPGSGLTLTVDQSKFPKHKMRP